MNSFRIYFRILRIRALRSLFSAVLAVGYSPFALGAEHELESSENRSVHSSPHTEESNWLLGVKGVQLNAFSDEGASTSGGGVGVFIERTVMPGWFELELSPSVVWVEGGTVVPIDLLLKKPFHLDESFCPYFALGPTLSLAFKEEATEVGVGAAFVVGAYIWFGEAIGLDVEVDYALLDENGFVQELTFAAGPTFRF